jgi:hypothetical protein
MKSLLTKLTHYPFGLGINGAGMITIANKRILLGITHYPIWVGISGVG